MAQRGHDGVGHRDRADVAGLGGPDRHLGRAHHVGARPVVGPRGGVQAVARSPCASARGRRGRIRPRRRGGRSGRGCAGSGWLRSASSPQRWACALPESAPSSVTSSRPHWPPSRISASTSTGDVAGLWSYQRRNLVGDDMRVRHATNVTFFRQSHKRRNTSAGGRRRIPTASGREGRPLVAATVDGDQHDAAALGAFGGRRGDRAVGRGRRGAALIDVAPERIHVAAPVDR